MTGPRRLLVVGLLAILVIFVIKANVETVIGGARPGVDVEIPLRAAERWLAGDVVYDPLAFGAAPGATQPFLYPPFVLPLMAVLTWLPRPLVLWGAVGLAFVFTLFAVRRLRIPWVWAPLVIAWPPFSEGIVDGNLVMLMFLGFVVLFYRETGSPWRPVARVVSDPEESAAEIGVLSAAIGAVKVSQPHAWLFVLHYRWRAAAIGAAAVAAVVLTTLPLTGYELWFDWLAQLRRAGDTTTWDLGGFAMPRFLPTGVGIIVASVCVIAIWFVPRREGGPWVGLLSTVGSLSMHIFGLLFLVPAMLAIRLEFALVAAIFISTYSYEGCWAGIILVLGAYTSFRFAKGPRRAWLGDGPSAWGRPSVRPPSMFAGTEGQVGPDTPFNSA